MSSLVVPQIDAKAITLGAEFTLLRNQAIAASSSIVAVTDAASQELATQAAGRIRGLVSQLEKDRKKVKAPVLDIGRTIDALAEKGTAPLAAELARVEGLIRTHYLAEQEKARQAAATQKRFDDIKRKRLEAEAAAAAAKAQLAEDAGDTTGADELLTKAEETIQKAQEVAAAAETRAPVVAPKADKMTVQEVWTFEVTDINALHRTRPTLVKLEVSTSAINAEIAGGMRECAGLRIWQETKVRTRA